MVGRLFFGWDENSPLWLVGWLDLNILTDRMCLIWKGFRLIGYMFQIPGKSWLKPKIQHDKFWLFNHFLEWIAIVSFFCEVLILNWIKGDLKCDGGYTQGVFFICVRIQTSSDTSISTHLEMLLPKTCVLRKTKNYTMEWYFEKQERQRVTTRYFTNRKIQWFPPFDFFFKELIKEQFYWKIYHKSVPLKAVVMQ